MARQKGIIKLKNLVNPILDKNESVELIIKS